MKQLRYYVQKMHPDAMFSDYLWMAAEQNICTQRIARDQLRHCSLISILYLHYPNGFSHKSIIAVSVVISSCQTANQSSRNPRAALSFASKAEREPRAKDLVCK